ncbi:MAG: DUF928 domain-containing protein [Cyanobacteria bacterium P01_A01_bin.17]
MIIKKFTHAATLVGMSSVLCLGALSSAVLAETAEITSAKSNQSGETLRQGLPGRRLGGGTRQGGQVFTAEYAYLAALTTSDNLNITTAQRPTLMFYIPDMTAEYTAELIIRDAQDNMVYEGLFQLGSEEGIVSFNTAEQENMPALALNETYQWYFSIIPEVTDRASDIVVNGNIRRDTCTQRCFDRLTESSRRDPAPCLSLRHPSNTNDVGRNGRRPPSVPTRAQISMPTLLYGFMYNADFTGRSSCHHHAARSSVVRETAMTALCRLVASCPSRLFKPFWSPTPRGSNKKSNGVAELLLQLAGKQRPISRGTCFLDTS